MTTSMQSLRKRTEKQHSDAFAAQSSAASSSWPSSHRPNCDTYPQGDEAQPPLLVGLFSDETMAHIARIMGDTLGGVVGYIKDLLLGTMLILRPLLSLLLALLVLLMIVAALTRGLGALRAEVQARVLCRLPLMGYFLTCDHSRSLPIIPNFTELVDKQAQTYEHMYSYLNNYVPPTKSTMHGDPAAPPPMQGGGSTPPHQPSSSDGNGGVSVRTPGQPLPMLLKKAEMAVVDLKVLVRHSTLPEETKELLVDRLDIFHKQAKMAGRKLQVLQTRANGCIDSLVIRNTFLTRELDRLSDDQHKLALLNAQRSALWNFLFGPAEDKSIQTSNQQLQTIYQDTMGEARNQVRDMILKAQDVLLDLERLDALLETIHDLASKEQANQRKERDQVLAILWTHLGFNQVEMRYYNENLNLLTDLDDQRKQTMGQVQATLWKLTEFEIELGLLREKMVDVLFDPALGERSSKTDPGRIPAPMAEEEEKHGSKPGPKAADKLVGQENVVRVLRSHIEQIDQVTTRLRQRSLVAGSIDPSFEWIAVDY